jgi:hypothetical protein
MDKSTNDAINKGIAAGLPEIGFKIERAIHGGFIVSRTAANDYSRIPEGPIFACTSINEALGFIKAQLEPRPIIASEGLSEGEHIKPDGVVRLKKNGECRHCGIPDGHLRDSRCTGACGPFERSA